MRRTCDTCGTKYQAQRSTSKYCSKKCNVRATRTRGKLVLVGASTTTEPATSTKTSATTADEPPPSASDVLAATQKELEQAGCLESALGQMAVQLAARIQYVPETGSGTAALSRELRAVLDAAKASSPPSGDRFDEISKRRQHKAKTAT